MILPNTQLLTSYKRHKESKSKIGQERSSLQQADYQCHRPTHSMNTRKCVHSDTQKTSPCQAFTHESSKVGRRVEGRETRNTGQEADGKKGSSTKQKPEEL